MRPHRIRSLLVCSTTLLLMACGGGGNGGPITLSASDASAVTQASSTTSEAIATQGTTLAQQFVPPNLIPGTPFVANAREQPLAISIGANLNASIDAIVYTNTATDYDCAILLDIGCTGSMTIEASYPHDAPSVAAGSYIVRTFNDLQGATAGQEIILQGTTRTDFLSAVDFTQTPVNVRMQITNTYFYRSVNGVSFGPHTGVALLEFDADGVLTYTVNQVSYSGLRDIVVTDRDNFSLGAATVRRPHWREATTYVVYVYRNWSVVAGRPAGGSTVTISTEGVAGNHVVTIATSSPTQVTYAVQSTVDGVVKNCLVTVDYAPGAEPVWSTVEVTG